MRKRLHRPLASAAIALAAIAAAGAAPRAPLPPPGFLPGCLDLIERERYAEARELLAPVVADHPGWARAQFYMALTYQREQRYGESEALLRRALQADPGYHMPRLFLGWCLYYLGRTTEAREAFGAYLAAKPDHPDAIFALGLIDFDEDATAAATRRFARAIDLAAQAGNASTEAKARARLADVHVRNGELDLARRELEQSVRLNPANYETYFKLSRMLQRLGDADGAAQAREAYEERLRLKRGAPAPGAEDPP